MDLGISSRRAAVAAGSAGLGLATARALVADGARVAICGRDPQRLDAAVADLGAGAIGIIADMSTPEGAVAFARTAAERLGGHLDIVVANSGGPPPGSASTTTLDSYLAAMSSNFLSTVALCNEVVGPMRAAGWGRILAITSVGARQPIGFLAASSSARAAVTSYIKNLATEVAADGVCANTIQPGTHATDRIAKLGGPQIDSLRAEIPAGAPGDPANFGQVAAFLCSEPARFICGASIPVDGGANRALQ